MPSYEPSWTPRPPPTHARVLDIDDLLGDWRIERDAVEVPVADGIDPTDVVVLIPTSGTTGRSKLVMQTQRAYAWAGVGFPWWMELTAADRMMTTLPLFHVNAPAYSVLGSLAVGAGLVLVPRFSASGFLDSARRHGATEFNAIGAMLEILMRQPERPDDADTDLRLCYTGPSPAREWQEAFEERFGLRVVCGYAMSESPYGLIWRHGTRPFGTLGSVRQHPTLGTVNEARVVDEDGADLGAGETGELLLRNPTVTPGYWQMPEETAAAVVDGWMHTGDLVTGNADEHLHLRRPQEGGAASARPEPLPARGRGGDRRAPGRPRGGCRRRTFRAHRGGGEGVRRTHSRGHARLPRAARLDGRAALGVQGPALLGDGRGVAAHADLTGGQAPAAPRPHTRGVRRRAVGRQIAKNRFR